MLVTFNDIMVWVMKKDCMGLLPILRHIWDTGMERSEAQAKSLNRFIELLVA